MARVRVSRSPKVETKLCTRCGKVKELSEFGRHKRYVDGLNINCKKCNTESSKLSRHSKSKEDYEIYLAAERKRGAKKRSTPAGQHYENMAAAKTSYGITEDEIQNLLNSQKGLCAICKADFGDALRGKGLKDRRQYDIDHCHSTGKVRGLLCAKCNLILGHFEKSVARASDFEDYLAGSAN